MKFYGTGAVWDGEIQKICARFKDGIFETDDMALIRRLDAMGVKHDELPEGFIPTETASDAELPDAELPDAELPDAELPDAELPDAEDVPEEAAGPTAEVFIEDLTTIARKDLIAMAKEAGVPKANFMSTIDLIKALGGEDK